MKQLLLQQKGFTIVESLVAIFILTMSLGALLTLAANGFYSVRYARNQIVADNLLQESVEYIRNVRDTYFLTDSIATSTGIAKFTALKNTYSGCFAANGCLVDIYTTGANFIACGSSCPYMKYYDNKGVYGYTYGYPFTGGNSYDTSYIRTIKMTPTSSSDYISTTVTVTWRNGATLKTISQTFLLTNWIAVRPLAL